MIALTAGVIFSRGWCLAALVAAAGPVLLWAAARRRGRRIAPLRVVLQCLAIAAAALALAGPQARLGRRAQKPWLVLNDVSASTRGQGRAPVPLPADVTTEVYDFAASVSQAGGKPDAGQTHLAPALRLAAARGEHLAGVIVRTDGQFTGDDWPAAAAALARGRPTVAIVALDAPPPDVRIAQFDARIRSDGRISLLVHAISNAKATRTLTVIRNKAPGARRAAAAKVLLKRELNFLPAEPVTISLTDAPPADRGWVYEAALNDGDRFAENDRGETIVPPARPRVAWVGPAGDYRQAGFEKALGLSVDFIRPEELSPAGRPPADYAAVVTADATGQMLSLPQRRRLARYVRSGGGLMILGAGPHQSPQDRLDPFNQVAALLPNPYDRRPMDVTVVLDASGSMGRQVDAGAGRLVKFDQATEAVLDLKRHLVAHDSLRVIVFAAEPTEVYAAGAGQVDFAQLRDALREVKPNGATKVFPALKLAAVRGAPGPGSKGPRQGLVLLVSDLQTERFEPTAAAEMFVAAGLRLGIVAIVAADQEASGPAPLEAFAALLGAPLEKRDHLVGLARVFGEFLRQARGPAVRAGRFVLTAGTPAFGSGRLGGRHAGAIIICAAQGRAEVILRAGGEAVMARRGVGLGRCVSIALPPGDRRNASLAAGADLAHVLAEAVRWTMRPGLDPRFSGQVRRDSGDIRVVVNARDDERPLNHLNLAARIISADAKVTRPAAMHQVAPGRYEARLKAQRQGLSVAVSLSDGRPGQGAVVWRGRLQHYRREFAAIGANWPNLRRLEQLAGGSLVGPMDLETFAARADQAAWVPLWPWLLAVALAVMLADWMLGRTAAKSWN